MLTATLLQTYPVLHKPTLFAKIWNSLPALFCTRLLGGLCEACLQLPQPTIRLLVGLWVSIADTYLCSDFQGLSHGLGLVYAEETQSIKRTASLQFGVASCYLDKELCSAGDVEVWGSLGNLSVYRKRSEGCREAAHS